MIDRMKKTAFYYIYHALLIQYTSMYMYMYYYTKNFILQKARKQKELKAKLQMAKFLQDTIEEMTVSSKNPKKQEAVEDFANFFKKVSL